MMKTGNFIRRRRRWFQMEARAVDYTYVGLGYDSGYYSYIIEATACLHGKSPLRIRVIEGAPTLASSLPVKR